MHSGSMLESGNGTAHRNFELLAKTADGKLRHWWRQGGEKGDYSWHQAELFGKDADTFPTLTATTFNRNFEPVHLTKNNRLHHWFFDQAKKKWLEGPVFGPTDAWGTPGFIQSNYGQPGNFEVVVRTRDGQLNHWWRINQAPWTWKDGGRFGKDIAYSGPSLVQAALGAKGNLEVVAVLKSGQMQHWERDNDHGSAWTPVATFGVHIASPPCMIEGQYNSPDASAPGNFELCVAAGGRVEHWGRDNRGSKEWKQSATFGTDVYRVVSLIEGSFGYNLEVIVLRKDLNLQHYYRDGSGWHAGAILGPA